MNDSGPYFDLEHSPFCPATGKLTRLCKGAKQQIQPAAPAAAQDTPGLVGQAKDDLNLKDQKRRERNQTVVGSLGEASWGTKLKTGQ